MTLVSGEDAEWDSGFGEVGGPRQCGFALGVIGGVTGGVMGSVRLGLGATGGVVDGVLGGVAMGFGLGAMGGVVGGVLGFVGGAFSRVLGGVMGVAFGIGVLGGVVGGAVALVILSSQLLLPPLSVLDWPAPKALVEAFRELWRVLETSSFIAALKALVEAFRELWRVLETSTGDSSFTEYLISLMFFLELVGDDGTLAHSLLCFPFSERERRVLDFDLGRRERNFSGVALSRAVKDIATRIFSPESEAVRGEEEGLDSSKS